ncbi:glycoside hydrolase family 18 protein, partial [Conidiobolus coronatus NRRL 28638]
MKLIVPTLAIINYWNNVQAFDIKSDKNLIAYWGQNSYGSSSEAEAAKMEKPLREYCNDDTYDMFVVSFLTKFNAENPSLYPELNLGKHCHQTFPGTNLANCPEVGQDIKYCQSKGKAVVLSMGGYSGDYTIKQEKHAHHLANKMWDLFLGGKSKFRPFGDVILDGVDLDIEKGPPENYATFTHALRNITLKDNSKKYYITAAPQCPYPDASLKAVLERGWLDAAFVQFYNNPCGLGSDSFNFEQWDNWAKTGSVNKDVKIYLGAPASPSASNTGYLPIKKLAALVEKTRSKHSSFGGVMIWDVSQGQAN